MNVQVSVVVLLESVDHHMNEEALIVNVKVMLFHILEYHRLPFSFREDKVVMFETGCNQGRHSEILHIGNPTVLDDKVLALFTQSYFQQGKFYVFQVLIEEIVVISLGLLVDEMNQLI